MVAGGIFALFKMYVRLGKGARLVSHGRKTTEEWSRGRIGIARLVAIRWVGIERSTGVKLLPDEPEVWDVRSIQGHFPWQLR